MANVNTFAANTWREHVQKQQEGQKDWQKQVLKRVQSARGERSHQDLQIQSWNIVHNSNIMPSYRSKDYTFRKMNGYLPNAKLR